MSHKKTKDTSSSSNSSKIIKITEDGGNICSFDIEYPEVFLANAIRRVIESDVPIYSPDVTTFVIDANVTKYHNERISARISQIPINNVLIKSIDNLTFKVTKKNGSPERISEIKQPTKSSSSHKTNEKPKSATGYNIYSVIQSDPVMSEDIVSSDGKKYFPDGLPIVNLRNGEKLDISSFKLRKGTCAENAIFKSTCCVGYKIIDEKPKTVRLSVEPRLLQDGISYPISVKVAVKLAMGALIDRLRIIDTAVKNTSSEPHNSAEGAIPEVQISFVKELAIVKIHGEGDTIGNLIQGQIVMDTGLFCGYYVEHPLLPNLIIKIMTNSPVDIITKTINKLIGVVEGMKKHFE
jgi:DNA-directed RNA polymerase subunit L